MTERDFRSWRTLRLAVAFIALSGCTNATPSALRPRGTEAERIAALWWFMFWVSAAVVVVVGALVLAAVVRRRARPTAPEGSPSPKWPLRVVLFGGVVVPVVVLAVLWGLTLRELNDLSAPPRRAAVRVDVTGRLWWWEVRYPGLGIVTANEIHIPVGQPVLVRLRTRGVIHSFWVPQLAGKIDMITGKTNTMWLDANRAGVYRGQCAEYCGLQHAHMIFYVVAEPPNVFRRWAERERQPAAAPAAADLARGRRVFENNPCAGCHTIRGTNASGSDGPDLTHFGSRRYIGAGTVPNDMGNLGGWIVDSQSIKPGNLMPPIQLGARDLQALIAYLESLR